MKGEWIVRTTHFKEAALEATVIPCTGQQKLTRSAQRFSLFALAALVCAFIPIAHFILVPAFLISGFFIFSRDLRSKYRIESGSFECPDCQFRNPIANIWLADELRFNCRRCGVQLVIAQGTKRDK